MDRPAVCVVGAGPRGVSVLERLAAGAPALLYGRPFDVHLVDPAEPGGGHVWRPDQPGHLLMNTVAAHATLFTDDTVRCEGPIVPGPTLHEWAAAQTGHPDPEIAAEAVALRPWSHPSRRFHGHYLRWAFQRAMDRLPGGMRVHLHRTRAVSLTERADGRQLVGLENGAPPLVADAVVIASGHTGLEPTPEQERLARHAAAYGLPYAGPANPLDLDLDPITPGTRVLLRGLGMNFFDVVSLLTTGRGGVFARDADGRLRYRPSGREPILCPGSRRGVPYLARGDYGAMPPVLRPRFFGDEAVARLLGRAGDLDFRRDLWPLAAKEAAWVYYDTLMRERPESFAAGQEEFRAEFAALEWDSAAMRELIARAVPDPAARLDFAALDDPLGGERFGGRDELNRRLLAHLAADVREAKNAVRSPLKRAMTALGATRARVRAVVEHGGLRGGSHRADLDGWFRGFAASLASGPPVVRIEELLALAEAGLLEFAGPGLRIGRAAGRFTGGSPQVDGEPIPAGALVEAYLPEADLRRTADPLLRQLRESGAARPYAIPDGGESVELGGVEITRSPHHVVTADGTPHPARFAIGIPVESVHWGTALGAMARADADLLRQADAVARAALTLLTQR
ncbi:FAD/NAD(P)-binding protein [Streptosporangium soli]|nr:FAD/NAD(P)-binding protein [Streptosporangium sp. KLBMP 9127]